MPRDAWRLRGPVRTVLRATHPAPGNGEPEYTMNDTVNFKPSDVNLRDSFPPLVDTMGSTETESAATLLVRVCQISGDAWGDVDVRALGEVIKADLSEMREPLYSMSRNPFCRPDLCGLVQRGCAEWVGEPGGVIRFTQLGLDRLHKVVERARGCER